MNLSAHRELKAYRDELARSIGGGRALERANATAHRLYGAAIRHADARKPREAISDRDIANSVRAVVAAVRGTVGVTEVAPGPKPKKRKDTAISEAVKAAVDRVVAETLAGKSGPGSGSGSAAAGAADRPLTELSDDALMDRLGEAMLHAGQAQQVTETAQPEPPRSAIYDVDLTGDPKALHDLAHDDFLDFLGAAFIADGEQRLSSPLFGNARALSPFMQGL